MDNSTQSPSAPRANRLLPESTRYIVRVAMMEEIIERIVGPKYETAVQRACRGFRRIEKSLYYINVNDMPSIAINCKRLANTANTSIPTINRDLQAINELFKITGGLRLHHWESGGVKQNEVSSNVFYWPSPGGMIIEEANLQIDMFVSKGSRARMEREERAIMETIIRKAMGDLNMQQLAKDHETARLIREARRHDRALTRQENRSEESNVVTFPTLTTQSITDRYRTYIKTLQVEGLSFDEADSILRECYAKG